MVKFGDLAIGEKFVHVVNGGGGQVYPQCEFFAKKSLSSAFILDPRTLEISSSQRLSHETFMGFGKWVEVHKLS